MNTKKKYKTARPLYYVLCKRDGTQVPVPVADVDTWARLLGHANRTVQGDSGRIVAQGRKKLGEVTISTVLLGGPMDGYQERCPTWREAEILHRQMVERVKLAVKLVFAE